MFCVSQKIQDSEQAIYPGGLSLRYMYTEQCALSLASSLFYSSQEEVAVHLPFLSPGAGGDGQESSSSLDWDARVLDLSRCFLPAWSVLWGVCVVCVWGFGMRGSLFSKGHKPRPNTGISLLIVLR